MPQWRGQGQLCPEPLQKSTSFVLALHSPGAFISIEIQTPDVRRNKVLRHLIHLFRMYAGPSVEWRVVQPGRERTEGVWEQKRRWRYCLVERWLHTFTYIGLMRCRAGRLRILIRLWAGQPVNRGSIPTRDIHGDTAAGASIYTRHCALHFHDGAPNAKWQLFYSIYLARFQPIRFVTRRSAGKHLLVLAN